MVAHYIDPPHQILTVKEVADYLRLHPTTIYRLIASYEIPAFRVGADWRFNRDAIDAWRMSATDVHTPAKKGRAARRVT